MPPLVPFGAQFREKYFTGFHKDIHNLNHGAYGATTPDLLEKKFEHSRKVLEFPDEFYRYHLYEANDNCRKVVADLVNCDDHNLVLVPNATTAVNSVLRSYPFKKGDIIICFATIYGSCYNTLRFLKRSLGIEVIKIDYAYPISNKEIIDKFKDAVKSCDRTPKMAFFDGISSTPSALFPWKEMVKLCKELGILSFVDAAHYIGLLPLDFSVDKPDFFTSNLHKWFFVPNSSGFLYVDPKHHSSVHSLPISAVYIEGDEEFTNSANLVSSQFGEKVRDTTLIDQFSYVSTLDYSSMLTIPDAAKFRKEVCGGEECIMEYNLNLAKEASSYILGNWEDSELMSGKEDNIITTMFNIKAPKYSTAEGYSLEKLTQVGLFVNDYLTKVKRTYVPVFIYNNALWSRWSTQIYLDLDDYKWGLDAIKEAFAKYEESQK